MWRLYHATKDGRLFNYPVHVSRARKAVPAAESSCRLPRRAFRPFRKYYPMYLEQGALGGSVAQGTLKRGYFPFEGGASSTDSAYIGWLDGRFNHQSHDVTLWQGLGQLLQGSYVAL